MKRKEYYLNRLHDKVPKEEADIKVVEVYGKDDKLIGRFWTIIKGTKKVHITNQSQGSWKPIYSEDKEDKEKKLRKYIMELDKRVKLVGKQDTFEGYKGRWVTLEGGQKVFIREGEMLSDALDRLKPRKYKIEIEEGLKNRDMTEKRIVRLMYDIPKKDLEGLKKVEVVEEANFTFQGEEISAIATYHYYEGSIKIEQVGLINDEIGKGILSHEVGHHKYRNIGNKKYNWDGKWRRGIKFGYKFPSDYAKTNADEGFAECYEDYRLNKGKNMDGIFVKWFKENIGQ